VRDAIHATLDADLIEAGVPARLSAHVDGCASCREFAAEMRAIQRALRALPAEQLPDAALEEVWRRTVRRRAWTRPRVLAASAAAIVVIALAGLRLGPEPAPAGPSEEELQHASREARMVLRLASGALRRTEQAAFKTVLAGEVSSALRRVPIRWPDREDAGRRGS
jgi:predicted anti-sigma-YlaC factor YlaD